MEKTKIVIAEHEATDSTFFEIILSKLGFTVYMAKDGLETIEQVKKVKPDLIIIDTELSKMSGWEVTSQLKTNEEYLEYKDIPIIMLSDVDNIRDKVEGIELGVEDYITKPYNFFEIYARIRAVIKNRLLYRHVLEREKKLATVESLNESLTYFTKHIKKPIVEIQKLVNSIDIKNEEEISDFVARVSNENGVVLAAIEGLEEEIKEIENRSDDEFSIAFMRELEEKFKKRYKALKDDNLTEKSIFE